MNSTEPLPVSHGDAIYAQKEKRKLDTRRSMPLSASGRMTAPWSLMHYTTYHLPEHDPPCFELVVHRNSNVPDDRCLVALFMTEAEAIVHAPDFAAAWAATYGDAAGPRSAGSYQPCPN